MPELSNIAVGRDTVISPIPQKAYKQRRNQLPKMPVQISR